MGSWDAVTPPGGFRANSARREGVSGAGTRVGAPGYQERSPGALWRAEAAPHLGGNGTRDGDNPAPQGPWVGPGFPHPPPRGAATPGQRPLVRPRDSAPAPTRA